MHTLAGSDLKATAPRDKFHELHFLRPQPLYDVVALFDRESACSNEVLTTKREQAREGSII